VLPTYVHDAVIFGIIENPVIKQGKLGIGGSYIRL